MRERPILFSAPMVRAILEGRKTQTRRIIKPEWSRCLDLEYDEEDRENAREWCRYGQPGDLLWVRETWRAAERPSDGVDGIRFAADDSFSPIANTKSAADAWLDAYNAKSAARGTKWRPGIHMPKWAARIWLEVTGVRVERLHAITEADAKAEGAVFVDHGATCHHDWSGPGPCPSPARYHTQKAGWHMDPAEAARGPEYCLGSARMAFANLWNKINNVPDVSTWSANPWVWVVEFKRAERKAVAA